MIYLILPAEDLACELPAEDLACEQALGGMDVSVIMNIEEITNMN